MTQAQHAQRSTSTIGIEDRRCHNVFIELFWRIGSRARGGGRERPDLLALALGRHFRPGDLCNVLFAAGRLRLRKHRRRGQSLAMIFYALALGAIGCALFSPLDDLASYLLIAHLAQHELLMMLAPPLILLANPVPVLMWGLSGSARLQAGKLLTRHSLIRRVRDVLGWMPVAWNIYVVNLWLWHYPAIYDAASGSHGSTTSSISCFFSGRCRSGGRSYGRFRGPRARDGERIFYLFVAAAQERSSPA